MRGLRTGQYRKDPGHGYLRGPARPKAARSEGYGPLRPDGHSLVFGSVATFALVGAGVLGSAWLAIALGQALLALALVSQGSADSASPFTTMRKPDRSVPTSLALAEREGEQCLRQCGHRKHLAVDHVVREQRPKQRV